MCFIISGSNRDRFLVIILLEVEKDRLVKAIIAGILKYLLAKIFKIGNLVLLLDYYSKGSVY